MKTQSCDVLVIGAGFAGVTVLRELGGRGRDVRVLEARGRIGGRTLSSEWNGVTAEFGGQWIHRTQPHVWSEVARYGLELYEREPVSNGLWLTSGRLQEGSIDDLSERYHAGWSSLLSGAPKVFPQPYKPFAASEALGRADTTSIRDALDELDLSPEHREMTRALASVSFNGDPDEGAVSQLARRAALAGSPALLAEAVSQTKLRAGSGALIRSILGQRSDRVSLDTAVRRVTRSADRVEVLTRDGTRWQAKAAVVTVPLSVLPDIEFEPALDASKLAIPRAGQMTRGAMLWVLARNVPRNFLCMAPPEELFTYARYDRCRDDVVLMNVFSPDARRVAQASVAEIEKGLRRWIPGLELVDFTWHDWVADQYSKQTWAMLKAGQLSEHFEGLKRREGNIFFAGADYADGWFGFIDGAIESALKISREVDDRLAAAATAGSSMSPRSDKGEKQNKT